jgi:GH18 family chitinase
MVMSTGADGKIIFYTKLEDISDGIIGVDIDWEYPGYVA